MRVSIFLAVAAAALATSGCRSVTDNFITGSISSSAQAPAYPVARDDAGWRAIAAQWQPIYDRNPGDTRAALALGHALRMLRQNPQAVAVLQTAAIKNSKNMTLLGEYGRALADNGNPQQAFDVFEKAHTPDNPNWRILMAQGAALDQMNRGDEARRYYQQAIRMVPNEPSVMSNYGLSLALSGDLANAEAVLRRANALPNAGMKVRQNLALVLALGGKFDEAQRYASQDLPPDQAAQNIAYLRSMVARTNGTKPSKAGQRVPATALAPSTGEQG